MISVIVPSYNAEDTIKRTLDSILAQTYPNLDIIAIDDGSTDHTGLILDEYAKEYPSKLIVIHTKNEGVTSARLRGVRMAKGEWIGFVDADDEIEPDMYEILLKNAKKYHADISHCGYQMIFLDGRIHYFHNTGCLVQQNNLTGLKDLLDGSVIEPGLCNKLFHKNLFQSLLYSNIMNFDIKVNEDLLMNFYLFSASRKAVFQDTCKYHYLVQKISATRSSLNRYRIYDPVRVKKIILENSPAEIKEDASRAYIRTCVYVYSGLALEGTKQFIADEVSIRKNIIEHKAFVHLLTTKQKIMAYLILYVPTIFKVLYRLYAKYFLQSKYD